MPACSRAPEGEGKTRTGPRAVSPEAEPKSRGGTVSLSRGGCSDRSLLHTHTHARFASSSRTAFSRKPMGSQFYLFRFLFVLVEPSSQRVTRGRAGPRSPSLGERGSAPTRGRHSAIVFPPSAPVQWQPDGLTIHTKKWFLGAGFLGAPAISLIPSQVRHARDEAEAARQPRAPEAVNYHMT